MECKECKTPIEGCKRRRLCKECSRRRLSLYRSKIDATTKCYYNLRQKFRANKIEEGAVWSRRDVAALVAQLQIPENIENAAKELNRAIRLKVVRVDETKPFLPSNSKVEIMGG